MLTPLWACALATVAAVSFAGWQVLRAHDDAARVVALAGGRGRPGRVRTALARAAGRVPGTRRLRARLRRAGLPDRPLALLTGLVVLVVLTRWAVDALLGSLFATVAVVAVPLLAYLVLDRWERRRAARLVDQLPDLTTALAGATAAGLSLRSALQVAAQDQPEPLGTELRSTLQMVVVGAGADRILEELAERAPSREMSLIVTTLTLQARVGGDLVQTLRLLGDALESRRDERREVRSLTASARTTSTLVAGLSIAVLVMFDLVRPGAVQTTTDHPLGRIAMLFGLAMLAVGLVVVARVTREDA